MSAMRVPMMIGDNVAIESDSQDSPFYGVIETFVDQQTPVVTDGVTRIVFRKSADNEIFMLRSNAQYLASKTAGCVRGGALISIPVITGRRLRDVFNLEQRHEVEEVIGEVILANPYYAGLMN